MRGQSFKIARQDMLRALAKSMREKQAQFDKETREYPRLIVQHKKIAERHIQSCLQRLRKAKTAQAAREAMNDCDNWKITKDLFPSPPKLNLCAEENFVRMLQLDTRKTIPVNSNSQLWALVEGKCEIVQAKVGVA